MAEEIKSKLQHLNGQPLPVIYRTLNNIVTELHSSQESVTQLISSLSYKDSFERLLKIKIIDSFKLAQYVVELLISEDPHLITCALQFLWFFEGKDKTIVNADYFNSNVFPFTSVSTRGRIIKLLSLNLKNEKQAEEFCSFIRKKYGDSQAGSFLPACSIPFVLAFQSSSNVVLTSAQLIRLFNKSQDFVHSFLIDLFQQKENDTEKHVPDYSLFVLHLARNHPSLFFNLHDIGKDNLPHITLGRRSSKKIVMANKSAVIESADKFIDMLQSKRIHKLFSPEEFETFYSKLFTVPFEKLHSRWEWSISQWFSLIKHLPDYDKVKFVLNIFQKRYGKNLLDHYNLIPENFVRLLPLEEKRKYVEKKLAEKNTWESKNRWICYSPVQESIPKIKELINEATDGRSRSEIVPYLVETCKINNDNAALLEVLRYFLARFRNDDVTVRMSFVHKVIDEFELLKLSDEHWRSLHELLQISIFNKELPAYWIFTRLLEKYVCYCISTSSPFLKAQIEQFIKEQCSLLKNGVYCSFSLSEPKFQKQFLMLAGSLLPSVKNIVNVSDSVTVKVITSFLDAVHKWNVEHKKDQLPVLTFHWVMPCLSLIFQSSEKDYIEKLIPIIYHDRGAREKLFSMILHHAPKPQVVMRFLKCSDHFEESVWAGIITYILEKNDIKQYKGILRKIILVPGTNEILAFLRPKCKELVEKTTGDASCHALYVMSLIDPEMFLVIAKSVHPSDSRVDVFVEGSQHLFELQKTAAKCFANIRPLSDLNLLLPFCQGDFLKLVLGSLTSISLNTAEIRILPFLRELSTKRTSVKKHSIRMLYRVLSTEEMIDLFSNLLQNETHPSIRKVLLEMIIDFFTLQPTAEKFELLKSAISSLTTKDKISFDRVPSAVNVPDSYKPEMFQLCWNVLLGLNSEKCNTQSFCVQLLQKIKGNISLLPDDFLKGLFSQYLFKLDSKFHSEVEQICISYMLNSKSSEIADNRISYILRSLVDFVSKTWYYRGTEEEALYPSRRLVSDFVRAFLTDSVNFKEKEVSVQSMLETFLSLYSNLMEGTNFKYFVLLQVYYFYFLCKDDPSLVRFGKDVGKFIDEMVALYGPIVISVITDSLSNFIYSIHFHIQNRYYHALSLEFVSGILSNTNSLNCMIAGIELLPIQTPYEEEEKQTIKEILTVLHDYNGENKELVETYLNEKVVFFY